MHEFYTLPMALRIRTIRRERGLNQQQLADMAGLSRSQLSEIETEAKPANTLRLNTIAAALGVPVESLFESGAADAYAAEITSIMARLSSEDRAAILRMARALSAAQ